MAACAIHHFLERSRPVSFDTRLTSDQDRSRLINVVDRARESWLALAPRLDRLRRDLGRAPAVPPAEVPPDVITMNSRFALHDPRSGETISYTLVYPESAAPAQGRISVLSPMGMALLGARVGENVAWVSWAGPAAGTVRRILYQPEAAGHRNL
jgi:regulator of nucleoside diphosphate kinase